LTEILLVARSGGRCEFCGCNEFLYQSALTGEAGNFSDKAHIVAFHEEGPRGEGDRPEDIDNIENLMLLCLRDHRVIDRNPNRYTSEVLREFKREHEARIALATGLGPEMQTTVLQFTGRIGPFVPAIARSEIIDALLPKANVDQFTCMSLRSRSARLEALCIPRSSASCPTSPKAAKPCSAGVGSSITSLS
jgi:hypothetical protein